MSNLNFAVYAEGCMYPETASIQPVSATISQLQESGFTTAILGLFHIGRDYDIKPKQIMGDIYFNNTLVISEGSYVGDSSWPNLINNMIGGSLTQVCASIGGGGVMDFETIQVIYEGNHNSFDGTNLMTNFQTLRDTFPAISIIDMDCEEAYDQDSFVAFCQMLIGMGFGITFCPYTEDSFWTGSLSALNTSNPGAVKWWNLQCYDGGTGNNPADWANYITQAIPGFPTNSYILPGDWSRLLAYYDGKPAEWEGDCPSATQALMTGFQGEACVGGGFIWTLDQIISYNYENTQKSDPDYCADAALMTAYVDAMAKSAGKGAWRSVLFSRPIKTGQSGKSKLI
jgi:hypothetical protein